MNPDEYVGVGRLSEALRDRFERVRLDYPIAADEVSILLARSGFDGADDGATGSWPRRSSASPTSSGPSPRWRRARACGPPWPSSSWPWPGPSLDGGTDWRAAAVAGLRVALRGRLSLRPTHRLAGRPEAYVEDALAAFPL